MCVCACVCWCECGNSLQVYGFARSEMILIEFAVPPIECMEINFIVNDYFKFNYTYSSAGFLFWECATISLCV